MNSTQSTGRVAVITGASSGIGAATARALAADGYRVALLARRLDRIDSLADELGNGAVAIQADVTDREQIVAAAQRVKDELGGADVLVNNAGNMLLAPFSSEQRADYRAMVERTLAASVPGTRVVALPMPLYRGAMGGLRLAGLARGLGDAVILRMREDLVFDDGPARRDLGYRPRAFDPGPPR